MYVLLIVLCPFVLFLLVIVLSVLLRYTDSDCPFGNFKLFLPVSLDCPLITLRYSPTFICSREENLVKLSVVFNFCIVYLTPLISSSSSYPALVLFEQIALTR